MIPSVVSWATGYMIVHGEEGAGWRGTRLTGQAEPEKSPRDLLFWVHIWCRTTECLHTLTADPPCCPPETAGEAPSSSNVPPAPSREKA